MLFRAVISLLSMPEGFADETIGGSLQRRVSARGKRGLSLFPSTNRWGSFRGVQPALESSASNPGGHVDLKILLCKPPTRHCCGCTMFTPLSLSRS